MLSIHLHQLQLFAHHGIYAEEKLLGNWFDLDLTIRYQPEKLPIQHLSESIDYVAVYDLVKERMAQATPLLETVITEIAIAILKKFTLAEEVDISIRKKHPPIQQIEGSVGISFAITRKEL